MAGCTYGIKKRAELHQQEEAFVASPRAQPTESDSETCIDNFLPIPAKKASQTAFPPGCAVLLCCYETPPSRKIIETNNSSSASSSSLAPLPVVSKVLPGIVQDVGVNLGSAQRENLYQVKVQDCPCHGLDVSTNNETTTRIITAQEHDLVHAIGSPVWFTPVVVHGHSKEQKGIILGAQQLPSYLWSTAGATGSSIWYSIQQPLGDSTGTFLLHHGVRAHKVRYRNAGTNHKTMGHHHHHVGKRPKEECQEPKANGTLETLSTMTGREESVLEDQDEIKEEDSPLGGHNNVVITEVPMSSTTVTECSPGKLPPSNDMPLPIPSKSSGLDTAGPVLPKQAEEWSAISPTDSEAKSMPEDIMGEQNEDKDVEEVSGVATNSSSNKTVALAVQQQHAPMLPLQPVGQSKEVKLEPSTSCNVTISVPESEPSKHHSTEEAGQVKERNPCEEVGVCEDNRPTASPRDSGEHASCGKNRKCLMDVSQNHEPRAVDKKMDAFISVRPCSGTTTGQWLLDNKENMAKNGIRSSTSATQSTVTTGQCLVDKENVAANDSTIPGINATRSSRSSTNNRDLLSSTKKKRALDSSSSSKYGVQLDESTFVSAEEIKSLIEGARMEANVTANASVEGVTNKKGIKNTPDCSVTTLTYSSMATFDSVTTSTTASAVPSKQTCHEGNLTTKAYASFRKVTVGYVASATDTPAPAIPSRRSELQTRRVINPNTLEGFRVGWNHDLKKALDTVKQIRTSQRQTLGGFGGMGEFLDRRCLRWHLLGKCYSDCQRASDHDKLSPETAKALEDALAPVTGPGGPIYGWRAGEYGEEESRKRQKLESFAPPIHTSANLIRFYLPAEFGKDFLIHAITGRCGSTRQDMCNQYACTIDFKGALMENTINHCSTAAKLFVEIQGDDSQKLSKCCQAIENILVQVVPKSLRGYLLIFLSFQNQRVVGGYRSLSHGIMAYSQNPFCSEDEGHQTHYICKLKVMGNIMTNAEFIAYKKKAEEQGCPPCSVYLVERDSSFPKIKPHIILASPNFDDAFKSRKIWRQRT